MAIPTDAERVARTLHGRAGTEVEMAIPSDADDLLSRARLTEQAIERSDTAAAAIMTAAQHLAAATIRAMGPNELPTAAAALTAAAGAYRAVIGSPIDSESDSLRKSVAALSETNRELLAQIGTLSGGGAPVISAFGRGPVISALEGRRSKLRETLRRDQEERSQALSGLRPGDRAALWGQIAAYDDAINLVAKM